jgi:hypothetical protein
MMRFPVTGDAVVGDDAGDDTDAEGVGGCARDPFEQPARRRANPLTADKTATDQPPE